MSCIASSIGMRTDAGAPVDPAVAVEERRRRAAAQVAQILPRLDLQPRLRRQLGLLLDGEREVADAAGRLAPVEGAEQQPDDRVTRRPSPRRATAPKPTIAPDVDVALLVMDAAASCACASAASRHAQCAVVGCRPPRSMMRPSASSNCGSWTGRIGAAAQLPDEAAEPDRAERERQHDVHPADAEARPGGTPARSARTDRRAATTRMPIATFTSGCGSRLTSRDSSSRNGTAKWNTTSAEADERASRCAAGAGTRRSLPAGCPTR